MELGNAFTSNSRKSNKVIDRPLTAEELQILVKVARDPFFFSTFIYVIHPLKGRVPFKLFPFQRAVLWNFINQRFNIILKFRQAGVTELIAMFCLWYAMYHPSKTINIISIKDTVAKKVLRKIKFMYRNLPDYLKVQVVNGRPNELGTASELEFSNGSLITSIPTTEEAGRSEALSLLVIDEAAIIRWAHQIWAAAFPTLSTGGRAILNSTPYGVGNFFHSKWVEACASGNQFNPIRLKWQMHPERDDHWYKEMATALGPRRTAQEIDGDFLTSGSSVFDLMDIRAMEESLSENVRIDYRTHRLFLNLLRSGGIRNMKDNLIIFNEPDPKKQYTIGGDVATGRARDYSTLSIMDMEGNEAAAFKMRLPINEYTALIGGLGVIYNRALLAPESNDIGLGVAVKLQDEGYHNLYYSSKMLKEKGKHRPTEEKIPGWYTTKSNRPIILSTLEEDIRLGLVDIKDPFFVAEAYTFIYDDRNRPVAMGKGDDKSSGDDDYDGDETYTDDAILGKAITNHVRKMKRTGAIVLPV